MARRGNLNGWWWFGIAVVGFFWRVLFRLRVEGADRVPSSGPAIVAGNHVSALDGVVLALTTSSRSRRMTRFLVAAEFSASSGAGGPCACTVRSRSAVVNAAAQRLE